MFIHTDELSGYWIDSNKELIVESYIKGGFYYSKIVWFDNKNTLVKKYDINGLSKDKWLGYEVLSDMKKVGDHWEGRVFDIKNGKHYNAVVKKEGEKLIVTGYIFISLFGKDVIFKKYKGKLPKQN